MDKSHSAQQHPAQDADFHPMYAMPPRYADDEISLVDLAKILIRRKVTMFMTAFAIIALALVFTQIRSEKFEYVSIYQVAEKGLNAPLVSPQTLTSLVEDSVLPAIQRDYRASGLIKENEVLEIELTNPKGTLLLVLSMEAEGSDMDFVKNMHQRIYNELTAYESNQIVRTKENLSRQLVNVQQLIDEVSKAETVPTELLAGYLSRKHGLEDQLDQLQESEVVAIASNNGKVSKFSNSLVLALGVVLGGIMGIMAAFMKEFAARVKESLQEDKA